MKVEMKQEVTTIDKVMEYFGFKEVGSCEAYYESQDIYLGNEVKSW